MTFFHGNNEESRDGLLAPPARLGAYGNAVDQERLDLRIASVEAGRALRASESSAHWLGEGARYLAGHPVAWARLWGMKIIRFAGAHDYADNYSFGVERALTPLLRLFVVPFPLILIPAMAGLVLRRPRGREESLLVLFASLGLLTCVLFYVGSRYRNESVPALAILAGRAVVAFRDAETRRRWASGALAAALVALALIPPGAPAASQDAMAAAQWAAALERDARSRGSAPRLPMGRAPVSEAGRCMGALGRSRGRGRRAGVGGRCSRQGNLGRRGRQDAPDPPWGHAREGRPG